MKASVLIFICLLGFSFSIFSAGKSKFSGDKDLYPEELKEYMKNLSEEHRELVDEFIEGWKEDSIYSGDEKEDIIALSQKLEKKNARPYPHFVSFLNTIMLLKKKGDSGIYEDWKDGFEFYLGRKKANSGEILRVLNFSIDFFGENILYRSRSTTWSVDSLSSYNIKTRKGLIIEFEKAGLKCVTRTDSINLYQVKGYVDPSENVWFGSEGLVTWERAGFERDQVNAQLKEYQIELKKSEYTAKDVTFTNKVYLDEPTQGDLQDKVMHIRTPEDANYPKFYSYEEKFELEDLYEGVNYSGGLSMQGAKLVGRGSRENPAKLFIFRKDSLVLEATSLYFGFKSDRVSSQKTSISIKLEQDSIFHPDLFFIFRVQNRSLTLLKTDNFSSLGPYYNSYHKIDMNFDQLTWNIDDEYMKFTAAKGASIGNAYFESENYFNYGKFLDLQIMDQAHPLISIRSFARHFGNESFPIKDYATHLNLPLTSVKHMVMRMAFEGFVFYDENTEWVTIKPRLHDYLAASVNRIDYDVMGFNSKVEAPLENAVFNLKTYDLMINGIPQIFVSDSQNVAIVPKNERIIVKKNRNFQFDGTVTAGLLTFYGNDMFFDYDSFKISLDKIDSINISFRTGKLDNYGLPVIADVTNRIENVTGEILIDKPDNKSGRIGYPGYPIFISKDSSAVYYNATKGDSVYKASNFYFTLDTFRMDSLDNFNAYAMKFDGHFVSAGILPELTKSLVLQPDYSLGFRHSTTKEGMPIYGGKAIFYDEFKLSGDGLNASGTLKYLTSTLRSDNFQFYPDSMNTIAEEFEVTKQTSETQYPRVKSQNNDIHWKPFEDVMWAYKIDKDFTIFNDSTTLSGDLQLEPTGLSGWGRLDLKNSDLFAEEFRFEANDIYADTSDFYLKSLSKDGFTVLTENVNSHISYGERKGRFKSNEDYSLVTFPENKYVSYIDYFIWDMKETTLAMGSRDKPEIPDYTEEDIEPEGPNFISTDPAQDSLSFVSSLAYYDYGKNIINATGVKFIEVADARIYPKDGLVTVQPNYKIKTLEDSWLKANTTTQFHKLYSASVDIDGRKSYTGTGDYNYVDENSDVQVIRFNEIEVDSGGQTVARGQLYGATDFTLSPVFKFQGKVSLFANDSLLTFDGATKIEHNCDDLEPEWFEFETRIDPNDIYIPMQEKMKDINNNRIFTGMFVYYDSVHTYPAFFTYRKNYSDKQMVNPKGFLHYDKAAHLYKVGSKEKIKDFTLAEEYVSLHREDCRLYGEGDIDLGHDLGLVTINNYGSVTHKIDENLTEFDLVMAIDFFLTENMINLMGTEIDSFPNLDAVDLNRQIYKKAMNTWLGKETAERIHDEQNLFGEVKDLPKELKHTILLNEIKLVWSDETNSYQSKGKIGIASINGIQINKKVDGFFELRIKRSGDIMDLYLQLDRRTYLYFGYTRGVMQTHSSNREYVETILNMKEKDRKLKTKRGQAPYSFLISTDKKKDSFYQRWQKIKNNLPLEEEIYREPVGVPDLNEGL